MPESPTQRRWPHAWVLCVAALAPLLAIAFAFALGPSPRKRIVDLRSASPARAAEILERLEPDAVRLLIEELRRPDAAHRLMLVKYLGAHRPAGAAEVLGALSGDPSVPGSVRSAAARALEGIDVPPAAPAKRSARAGGTPAPVGAGS